MSKISYLIGAGASFHAIPLVNSLNESILNLIDSILSFQFKENVIIDKNLSINENIDIVKNKLRRHAAWLKKELGDNSIDRLAKQLHDLDQNDHLKTLKAILSAYIVFEHFNFDTKPLGQANRSLDPRYQSFFARVSRKEDYVRINKSISIISWNYDLQFEKLYSSYYPSFDFYELSDILNNYPALNNKFEASINKFKLIRLNGFAGSLINIREKRFHSLLTNFNEEGLESAYKLFLKIYLFLNQPPTYVFSGLRFAFENNFEWYDPIEIAKHSLNSTEFLVIIGYSFPDFNREYDSKLIKSMNNLKKIYIQDSSFVYNRIKEIIEVESNLKPEIINVQDFKEFYSPPIQF